MLQAEDYFQWQSTTLAALFVGLNFVWEALARIEPWLEEELKRLSPNERSQGIIQPGAFVNDSVILGPTCCKRKIISSGSPLLWQRYLWG